MNKRNNKQIIYEISILGVFAALIGVLVLANIGNIPLGFVSITILHIIVAIAAMLLGKRDGAILGFFWGIFSLIQAAGYGAGDATFVFPWVSVLPRVVVGFLYGYIFELLNKKTSKVYLSALITGICVTIIHTYLVYIFYMPTYTYMIAENLKFSSVIDGNVGPFSVHCQLWVFGIALFSFNCLFESIACGIITTLVVPPLKKSGIVNKYVKNISKNETEE